MKTIPAYIRIAILLFVFSSPLIIKAQTADSVYIVTYSTGKAWNHSIKVHEQQYFKEHSTHLSNLRKTGVIQVGLRDREHGILLIYANSLRIAKELIQSDVAVVNQLFTVTVEKANVFYTGCLEKVKPN